MIINDNHFQQAVLCPLKLYHYHSLEGYRKTQLPFKHRNKLQLRDIISLRFENRRFTSDETSSALDETNKWLAEKDVAICGAVIKSGEFVSRIPILVKQDNVFTIVQVHGKLRKRSEPGSINSTPKKRTTALYLLKAAYRAEVLRRLYPEASVRVEFYFPERGYKSSVDNLLRLVSKRGESDQFISAECDKLFAKVEATKGVEDISRSVPVNISHSKFTGLSVSEICNRLESKDWSKGNQFDVKVNQACKYCEFRKNDQLNKNGCWNQFFFEEDIAEPARHVFELIGHGNEIDTDNGYYYQEQVPFTDQFSSFDLIEKYGGPNITIQQRRVLQLLKAKGDKIPKLWVKPSVNALNNLTFPLHFIDFEAATYAIPMQRGSGPYTPVYFQFSCHTMQKDGEITHSEWLDSKMDSAHPHINFVKQLSSVPDIMNGTIVQYSQFEQRALNQIYGEFKRNSMLYENEISLLNGIINAKNSSSPRFFDLSRLINDSYFNKYLDGGLGLKHVLKSILMLQKNQASKARHVVKVADVEINLLSSSGSEEIPDPYSQIQNREYSIDDGATAMNAYISLKSDLLTEKESEEISKLLRRYCALDSYSLVVIFNHLKEIYESMDEGKDYVDI